MPAGLQTWDENGNLIVDITTRLSKYIGAFSISSPGSIVVALPEGNEIWATVLLGGTPSLGGNNFPYLTISGSTLSWNYSGTTNRVSGIIMYGVY